MASVHKKGKDKGQGKKISVVELALPADHGTSEQRLKREVAAGYRSEAGAQVIVAALEKARRINAGEADGEKKTMRGLFEAGHLTEDEFVALRDFNAGDRTRTGMDGLGILLARRIVTRDEFETALDFTACWCVVNGKPWPKGWKAQRQSPDHAGGYSEPTLKEMKNKYFNCLAEMEGTDKTIYPVVSDIVVHDKVLGVIEGVVQADVVRIDGVLIGRKHGKLPDTVRHKLSLLAKGIQIIGEMPDKNYTKEALAMIDRMRERDGGSIK